jgi:hypothetical protein
MIRIITFLGILFLVSCSNHKKLEATTSVPLCLQTKIKTMAANPSEGLPQSVTRYNYKGQTVYYMVAHCCDKFNIVFDSACNILGYPDGGYTGRGDGKMPDFHDEATEKKIVWEMK